MSTFRFGLILVMLAIQWGCSSGNGSNTVLDATGKHPASWIVSHREAFRVLPDAIDSPTVAATSNCVQCHGKDLKGGISKVSCFSQGYAAMTCHFHPTGYNNPAIHGADAKGAGVSKGFRSCQGCHGSGYAGGVLTTVPCFACHGISAPHAKNWATSTTYTHSNTDPSNAAECAQCHSGGRLLTNLPAPPQQPAGTPPGCFNNTLCHAGLHPVGWINPAQHGAAAKSQPGTGTGFNNCQSCHGSDFKGGTSGVSCFSASSPNGSCHVRNGIPVGAPHSPLPWRQATDPTHTDTVDDAQGLNAAACALCHTKGANLRTVILTTYASGTPGCFNSTLCHGAVGHPAGWADPTQHGATAKANLTYCAQCHSDKPNGGPGSDPRFNVVIGRLTAGCETCHVPLAAHPPVQQIPAAFVITNPDPLGTPWFRHRTATNFDACRMCHGANLDGVGGVTGASPCQKCHVAALPTTIKNCQSCHSQPPTGTVYPNINNVHSSHAALNVAAGALCVECHSGLGSGTLDHFNRARAGATSVQPGAVVFGGVLSKANGAAPTYTDATKTCANTYCHGNTLDKPASAILSPSWTTPFLTGNATSDCTKCHGYPPQTAVHTQNGPQGCITCHPHVNAAGTGFTDPTKHINGVIDAIHAVPYFTHNTAAATTCLAANGGCHNTGTGGTAAANQYPLAKNASTGAPDCMSCHTLADPLSAGNGLGNCKSCHGTGGTTTLAAPTGINWPNIRGSNTNARHPSHQGSVCGDCHPGVDGTGRLSTYPLGSVNHGPNKSKLSGTTQTNTTQVVTGIVPRIPRGTGSDCTHSSLPNNSCHRGPATQEWAAP